MVIHRHAVTFYPTAFAWTTCRPGNAATARGPEECLPRIGGHSPERALEHRASARDDAVAVLDEYFKMFQNASISLNMLENASGPRNNDNVSLRQDRQDALPRGTAYLWIIPKMIMINNNSEYSNVDNMPIRQDHEDALRGRRFSTVAPLRCKITITPKARCF